jgi:hypothetical protein
MNKKLWIGFVAVFVAVVVIEYIVNNMLMMSVYQQTANLWRPMEEMKMGLIVVTNAFFAFFFTLIFSKGYEGKGLMEGVRYGFYVAMMVTVPAAYVTYATMPVPYELALKWFLYGTIENIILGCILSLVYGKKQPVPAA